MKLLLLRGKVPTDRSPTQIMFDSIDECDDVWSQLAYHLCRDDYGEIWYWGGNRKVEYKNNFVERWVRDFQNYKSTFTPDVIFARGGFKQYDTVLDRFPKAYKIYYGAGKRFIPQTNKAAFDLILVDTPKQLKKAKSKLPKSNVQLLIKPAADNIFRPIHEFKKYDVIFSSNLHPSGIKGHDFILPALPKDMKMIQVGIGSNQLKKKFPHIEFTGWIPRRKIPKLYAKSKVAVICCTNVDSCPRIISEALACDCPILLLDSVNLWHDKYINSTTGRVASKSDFISELKNMIDSSDKFSPRKHYDENLSLKVASNYIKTLIR